MSFPSSQFHIHEVLYRARRGVAYEVGTLLGGAWRVAVSDHLDEQHMYLHTRSKPLPCGLCGLLGYQGHHRASRSCYHLHLDIITSIRTPSIHPEASISFSHPHVVNHCPVGASHLVVVQSAWPTFRLNAAADSQFPEVLRNGQVHPKKTF